MKPLMLLEAVIRPTCAILGDKFQGKRAEVLMLAIAFQESGINHRRQIGGPAVGYWQFEKAGGVAGVLRHPQSANYVHALCEALDYVYEETDFYEVLAHNAFLAAGFARLLLYTDSTPLPEIGSISKAWNYYLRNWRPGKPHPETWPDNYIKAVTAVECK